jgi:LPS O-antigen subunit length determinant protein (WzzB/FepE family)
MNDVHIPAKIDGPALEMREAMILFLSVIVGIFLGMALVLGIISLL